MGPSPPKGMNIRCAAGATVTPRTSALVWGREIVLMSLYSWSMSYTEVTPSWSTYSTWETPAPEALTTALGVDVAGAEGPASFVAGPPPPPGPAAPPSVGGGL